MRPSGSKIPRPVELPDAEDRLICQELENRRGFPVYEVIAAITDMSQRGLIEDANPRDEPVNALLSQDQGLQTNIEFEPLSDAVSITPIPRQER